MKSVALTKLAICVGIAVVTLGVFWQVGSHQFITAFDDDVYVIKNLHVQQGITPETLGWAFTSDQYASNWHPLTWISHMVDFKLFGMKAGGHHMVSLILHVLAAMLLFLAMDRLTRRTWLAAFVAALFALHPLHVESVAWIAERKDVLSGLFWMLTMLAYAWYAEKPAPLRYIAVLVSFALGLLSKPMLVTLPLALLILDFWPLRRARSWGRLVLEKVPLLALSAVSVAMTLVAQQHAMAPTDSFYSRAVRIDNALVSYATYLVKTVWPVKLAIYYPHPGDTLPIWQIVASALLLAALTALAVRLRRSHPYLLAGWLWYVVTLVPVIGLVQVGGQAYADRYTYIPLIGVFFAITWLAASLLPVQKAEQPAPKARKAKPEPAPPARISPLVVPAAVVLIGLSYITWKQVSYWKDDEDLWRHCLAVTDASRNERGHLNLAFALSVRGKTDEAIEHYRAALAIQPNYVDAHNNLGVALLEKGRVDEAMGHFQSALQLKPGSAAAWTNVGIVHGRKGHVKEAIEDLRHAIDCDPAYVRAHYELTQRLLESGDPAWADEYKRTEELSPNNPMLPNTIAWILATSKNPASRSGEAAVRYARKASAMMGDREPSFLDTLAAAYAEAGKFDDAIATAQRALDAPAMANAADLAKSVSVRLALYKSHKPYRE